MWLFDYFVLFAFELHLKRSIHRLLRSQLLYLLLAQHGAGVFRWIFHRPRGTFCCCIDHYSAYSDSQNVFCLCVYVAQVGVRLGSMLFCLLIFLGQLMFALGVQFKSYWVRDGRLNNTQENVNAARETVYDSHDTR